MTTFIVPTDRLNDPVKENCIKWLQTVPIGTRLRQAALSQWCKWNHQIVTIEDVARITATRATPH